MTLITQKKSTFSLVLATLKYLPITRKYLPYIFLFMIAAIACIVAEPYIYKILFDKIEVIGKQIQSWGQIKQEFLSILLIWGATTVFASIFGFVHSYLLDSSACRDWTNYLTNLGANFLSLPYGKLLEKNTGSHQSVYQRSGWSILRLSFQLFGGVAYSGLLAISMIALGLYTNWKITLVTLAIVPVYALLSWYIGKKANEAYEKSNAQADILFGRFSDILTNITAVRVFGGFDRSLGEIRRHADILTRESINEEIQWTLLNKSTDLVDAIGRVIVLGIGIILVTRSQIGLGDVVLFLTIMNRISAPITRILASIRWMTEYFVDLEKAIDVIETPKELDSGNHNFKEFNSSIEFQNVTFAYPESERVILENISLSIKKGQKVAFVGHTGSGKSTITKLFARFYDIEDGAIFIDDVDIQSYTLSSYREKTAMVFQETTLFNDTITYNLRYAKPEATDEEIREACRKANILDFIDSLEKGFETEVGERGLKLSGGEKQRIAIARAILANPEILILDEPTSALDSTTEQTIQSALDILMKGRTSIIIAHRLSTIQHADCIFLLDHGHLIGQGTHKELYANNLKYQEMVNYQKNGFIA